ncbi:MAG TPA: NAD(P)H-binding protein, partial [Dermatophilaceae bacterium]|nr:NAD(P)H-binding protein [Dermatophilaceae bacterium]
MTGATGYIGGRLIPELLGAGFRVRVMARQPRNLADRPWHDQVEVVRADATDTDSLSEALSGVDVAYYLIHSLGTGKDFEAVDRRHARNFASAARACKVGRIIYLGGLYPEAERLSPHLESRKEVGEILLAS